MLGTYPNQGVLIKGKIFADINHLYSFLVFHRVVNETGGGSINFHGIGPIFSVKSELRFDSIYAELFRSGIMIDSSKIYASARIQSHSQLPNIPNPPKESRISASTFYGDFSLTDTFELIDEARGYYHLNQPLSYVFGGPNIYYGNAHFKGRVNLGLTDTSSFFGNLTIEARDSSVYHRAKFTGDENAEINIGSTPIQYAIIDKSGSGNITLTAPVNVSGFMRFNHGLVQTSNHSYLNFLPGAMANEYGELSYVYGEVRKEGNTPFEFPTGSAGKFKPLTISAPLNITDIVAVQYHDDDVSAITDTAARTSGLSDIGNCEYWELKQLNGNSQVTIAASWDETCLDDTVYFTDPANAKLARWDGNLWVDEGNGGYANGYISSQSNIIPNGVFTFATPRRPFNTPNPDPEPPAMMVYPNPAGNFINVVVDSAYNRGVIIDAIGRTISIHPLVRGLNTIDVTNLPTGVYFIKLITNRKQKVLKWVKG